MEMEWKKKLGPWKAFTAIHSLFGLIDCIRDHQLSPLPITTTAIRLFSSHIAKHDTPHLKSLRSTSNTFTLADLGCSVGSNTLNAIQNLIESQNSALLLKFLNSRFSSTIYPPTIFNTLFNSLPQDRQYFAAGVPGSFYGRLFPESSIHFAYSATALHWLSKVPKELQDRNYPTWNKGRIHYTSASDEVVRAYSTQFAEDMVNFLNARAKEIVRGGMMVIIVPSISNGVHFSQVATGVLFICMGSSLTDTVKLRIIPEQQVDSFNLPFYGSSSNEMKELIENHGGFSIEKIHSPRLSSIHKGQTNIRLWMAHIKAAMEGRFARQFGNQMVDEMFQRFTVKIIGGYGNQGFSIIVDCFNA